MIFNVQTSPIHNLEIEFPPPGTLARRPIHRGQFGKRYKRRSEKSITQLLKLESPSEFIYSCILDCAFWVTGIQEQPVIIKYFCSQDKKIKKHYPDFLVTHLGAKNPTFVEVKSDILNVSIEVDERTKQLKRELEYLGFNYKLIIINRIPETIISNCIYLLRLSRFSHLRNENLHKFYDESCIKNKFWGEFNTTEKIMLSRLFIRGEISIGLLQPITAETNIEWRYPTFGDDPWHNYL